MWEFFYRLNKLQLAALLLFVLTKLSTCGGMMTVMGGIVTGADHFKPLALTLLVTACISVIGCITCALVDIRRQNRSEKIEKKSREDLLEALRSDPKLAELWEKERARSLEAKASALHAEDRRFESYRAQRDAKASYRCL